MKRKHLLFLIFLLFQSTSMMAMWEDKEEAESKGTLITKQGNIITSAPNPLINNDQGDRCKLTAEEGVTFSVTAEEGVTAELQDNDVKQKSITLNVDNLSLKGDKVHSRQTTINSKSVASTGSSFQGQSLEVVAKKAELQYNDQYNDIKQKTTTLNGDNLSLKSDKVYSRQTTINSEALASTGSSFQGQSLEVVAKKAELQYNDIKQETTTLNVDNLILKGNKVHSEQTNLPFFTDTIINFNVTAEEGVIFSGRNLYF